MKKLSKKDLHDILLGATIVGTGGGGTLEEGIEIVDKAIEEGFEFLLADNEEIPEEALVGTPYGCGSISPFTEKQKKSFDSMDKIDISQETAAMKVLEKYYGKEFYGVIATELGGLNTAVALEAAARLGKPIIDGDPTGRSVPCLQHTTYYLNDIPIAPMGLANQLGDEMVITKVQNDERAEEMVRAIAVASFNSVGVVDHPGKWGIIKNVIHHNTITWCLEIGRVAQKHLSEGKDYVDDIVDRFNGYHIFNGTVGKVDWKDENGFTYGNIYIEGSDSYDGHILRIWYQNENIMSWMDGKYYVMSPDLINIIDCNSNMPLLNPYAKVGDKVKVFGLKARKEWREKKGLNILGPKFFGFDTPYNPIEDIVEK